MGAAQSSLADRRGHRLDDLVAARRGIAIGGGDRLAPPLQPDQAEHLLTDALPHPRDLIVESIEREERLALAGRREQCGLKAVAVMAADQHRCWGQHRLASGTAFQSQRFLMRRIALQRSAGSKQPGWKTGHDLHAAAVTLR